MLQVCLNTAVRTRFGILPGMCEFQKVGTPVSTMNRRTLHIRTSKSGTNHCLPILQTSSNNHKDQTLTVKTKPPPLTPINPHRSPPGVSDIMRGP